MSDVTMLVILDGFGYRAARNGNAIAHAKMPFWNFLCTNYPTALLNASGDAVGLLDGYMGNSEVGHLTIGAGRVIPSPLKKFHDAIDNGSFFNNKTLIEKLTKLKHTNASLHLMGLVSDGGVHSHEYHLQALIKLAHQIGITKVFIHAFLDGRDTPPTSAATYLDRLEKLCTSLDCGTIASIHGRFYAMDRDKNWERTKTSYDLLCGINTPAIRYTSWRDALSDAYKNNTTDEFVTPQLLTPDGIIKPGDGVIFFNFRPDRARQLTETFINQSFQHFANPRNTGNKSLLFFITATRYQKEFDRYNNDIIFEQDTIDHTLLDEIAEQTKHDPKRVFLIAETEKYAHVTYFFRGMKDIQLPQENRILIPSIKARSYAATPEMAAPIITETLIESLQKNPAFFYLINYANADMVGHSGDFAATIKACEILDQQLAALYHKVVEQLDGTLIITADHGNAEEKIDEHGNPRTAHTCNPVPFIVVHGRKEHTVGPLKPFQEPALLGLAHIAPTLLTIMGLKIPQEMEKKMIV